MQKQHDEASKQCQEKKRILSEETVALREEINESGKFSKTMDWTASYPVEENREMRMNSIALQRSLKLTEKSLDRVTLGLDGSESLVKRRSQQLRDV